MLPVIAFISVWFQRSKWCSNLCIFWYISYKNGSLNIILIWTQQKHWLPPCLSVLTCLSLSFFFPLCLSFQFLFPCHLIWPFLSLLNPNLISSLFSLSYYKEASNNGSSERVADQFSWPLVLSGVFVLRVTISDLASATSLRCLENFIFSSILWHHWHIQLKKAFLSAI